MYVLTGNIEVLYFSLGSFVGDPLVVYDEVVGYGQLVVRVPAQQRVVYLVLLHTELVAHLGYRLSVDHAAVL